MKLELEGCALVLTETCNSPGCPELPRHAVGGVGGTGMMELVQSSAARGARPAAKYASTFIPTHRAGMWRQENATENNYRLMGNPAVRDTVPTAFVGHLKHMIRTGSFPKHCRVQRSESWISLNSDTKNLPLHYPFRCPCRFTLHSP